MIPNVKDKELCQKDAEEYYPECDNDGYEEKAESTEVKTCIWQLPKCITYLLKWLPHPLS